MWWLSLIHSVDKHTNGAFTNRAMHLALGPVLVHYYRAVKLTIALLQFKVSLERGKGQSAEIVFTHLTQLPTVQKCILGKLNVDVANIY